MKLYEVNITLTYMAVAESQEEAEFFAGQIDQIIEDSEGEVPPEYKTVIITSTVEHQREVPDPENFLVYSKDGEMTVVEALEMLGYSGG